MYLSGDAKDLLYKCTILTAMMRRLTRVLFGHTFGKLTFKVNKINHKKRCCMKRLMYRMRRLILVFTIRTCYKCDFCWYLYSPIRSRPYGLCDQIHFIDCSGFKNCLCERGRLPSKPNRFQYDQLCLWSH